MNDTEQRLRDAMRAKVDGIDGDPSAWQAVQREVVRRRRTRRRVIAVAAVSTAAALVAVYPMTTLDDDPTRVDVTPATDAPADPTTTVATVVVEPEIDGIWPFTTSDDVEAYVADPGVGMFFDPEATALEFAREYLDMPDPQTGGEGVGSAGDTVFVDLVHKPTSRMVTRVWLRPYDGVYTVFLVETANIEVDRAAYDQPVTGTIPLSGRSSAFEAQVNVEVRDADGNVLGQTFVMGGGGPDLDPFSGEIVLDRLPSTSTGAVLFVTYSAEDGALQEATVVPITFADAESRAFSLFFHRGDELAEVRRSGPATTGVLAQALHALVAGPLPEDGDGLSSMFSADTADILAGVNLRDGTAIVDFAHTVDNASTAAGSEALLAELNATIFQFPTVERIEYRLQGSCDGFWLALERDGCTVVDRP